MEFKEIKQDFSTENPLVPEFNRGPGKLDSKDVEVSAQKYFQIFFGANLIFGIGNMEKWQNLRGG